MLNSLDYRTSLTSQEEEGYSTNSTGDLVSCSKALVSTNDDIW